MVNIKSTEGCFSNKVISILKIYLRYIKYTLYIKIYIYLISNKIYLVPEDEIYPDLLVGG